jgi:hypothetical protein
MKVLGIFSFALMQIFYGNAVFGATSGTLIVSGTVAPENSVVIAPYGTNNTSLDILNGEIAKTVATVTEVSNIPSGYKIKMSSANGGKLQRTSTDFSSYQVSYDGGGYAAPSVAPATVKTSPSLASRYTFPSLVKVNLSGRPNALAGIYSDTITISIEANP